MFKSVNRLMLRAIAEFVVLSVILSIIGSIIYFKIDAMLK